MEGTICPLEHDKLRECGLCPDMIHPEDHMITSITGGETLHFHCSCFDAKIRRIRIQVEMEKWLNAVRLETE